MPLLAIALPVGVSFFTFQAISYVVDVKRRLVEPASTIDVAVYLSFFPHLVAGPIVRAREFLPQLATPRDPNHVAVGSGLALIGLGLVKKVVIADYLARTVVDPVFAVPQSYHGADVLLAAYAYTAQIYCDFSGYTDMAIGLALLLGFVFPQNFRSPYRSLGFRDFWRRWHMTLSRFLRDFLYIPLGGNRKGKWKTYRNLFLTMLLGGLWHGAAWTFVLWGAFHGAGLCLEHGFARQWERVPKWLRWFVTFHLVVLGWIMFRAQSLSLFWATLHRHLPRRRADVVDRAGAGGDRAGHRPAAAAFTRRGVLPGADRAPQSRDHGRRPGRPHPVCRRHGSRPRRRPVHLLPVLGIDARASA